MGRIVGAFGSSHVLVNHPETAAVAERVIDGMRRIGAAVRAARPDLLLIVSSDHMVNLNLRLQPPFVVGVADEHTPLGDMQMPRDPIPGHRDFAEGLVRFAAGADFDLAKAEELLPDHGVVLPFIFATGGTPLPTVPLLVNVAMDPPPSPRRCFRLGRAIRDFVETTRPADERVVVLGTGGLSHWICMPQMGMVNETFDRWVLERFAAGDAEAVARLTSEDVLRESGNGGLEILNWLVMAGAAGPCTGEAVYYEPIPQWFTGMGGVRMNVQPAVGAGAGSPAP